MLLKKLRLIRVMLSDKPSYPTIKLYNPVFRTVGRVVEETLLDQSHDLGRVVEKAPPVSLIRVVISDMLLKKLLLITVMISDMLLKKLRLIRVMLSEGLCRIIPTFQMVLTVV